MFRKLFLAATVTAGFFLFGCNNSSSLQSITVKIDGMSSIASEVYLDIMYNQPQSFLAKAEVKDDQFTIKLPETIEPAYLRPIEKEIGCGEGVTISDPLAKCCEATIEILEKGKRTAYLYCERDDNAADVIYAEAYIFYVDNDVTITGFDDTGKKFNCSLKKGWNYVADIFHNDGSSEMTTTLPKGMEWKYSFYDE